MKWLKKKYVEVSLTNFVGTLRGELSHFEILKKAQHAAIWQLAGKIASCEVTEGGILKVLLDYRDRLSPDELVQAWAFFVLFGFLPDAIGPVQAIDINRPLDDDVTNILVRLSELGDSVDGTIGKEELDEFIALLSERT